MIALFTLASNFSRSTSVGERKQKNTRRNSRIKKPRRDVSANCNFVLCVDQMKWQFVSKSALRGMHITAMRKERLERR